MNFLENLDTYLVSNPFFSLECNFEIDLKRFQSNNKEECKCYNEFLKDGLIERSDDFYNKFVYLNENLGKCDSDEEFKKIILELFELIKVDDNYLLHNYLLHLFSITNNEILNNNLTLFEENFLNILYSREYIDISSINSLMFAYLVLLHHLKMGGYLGIFKQFIMAYRAWDRDFWNECKLERKKNYGIIIYQIQKFHNAKDAYLDFEIFTVYDAIVEAYKNVGDFIHSSIFCDLSNQLKENLISSQRFHKEKLFKLLNDNDKFRIKNILYKINSYRKPITIETLYAFLYQFDSIENLRAMLKVLENLNYFDYWMLNEILENILIKQIDSQADNIYICPLEADGSSSIYQYLISHSDHLNEYYGKKIKFERSISDVLKISKIEDEIIIIDDCSLSGTQTSSCITELLGIREMKDHYDKHCDKLEDQLLEKFRIAQVNLCFCVGSNYAKNVLENLIIKENLKNFKVYIGKYLHMTKAEDGNLGNRIFGSNSLIWESSKERDNLKEFCQSIGYQILSSIAERKNWDEDRRVQSSLGYSDLQQVIIFPYSVPKTTLPILWCEGENWKPLFPNT
ncbi:MULTISPECIES: hypothetical protein [unclassified Acinetobacter]|uniref:phosphoribosyltransferase-like protein n=1 Tax=unclassified Acinetobacter TaxID=196816 RepID=UPI0025BD9024|nr:MULTISPECIES: hypothetical protein [unclassified Acinetobacter]